MQAEIISVGTEILLGDVVDTNASYIARKLVLFGIDLFRKTVVGDNKKRLARVLRECLERVDLIIVTGGLGPTEDDITKEVVSELMGQELVFSKTIAQQIKKKFPGINPYGDADMDGSMNYKDCKPFDASKDGLLSVLKGAFSNKDKLARGFADEENILKNFVRNETTSAREIRTYQKTSGFLDTATTDDTAISLIPTSQFATDKHFMEIGHILENTGGAGLARTVLHFN
ncbi:hypothetical protein LCGC14_1903210 [marine sediment metagenome]|uniref:MoaB/Mog domain-containing protein n=1 Tax=marine sediment metagenome TaxID=412755 RepID=A0A0F9ITZ5_9ZZZZ